MDSVNRLIKLMKRLRNLRLMDLPQVSPELTLSQIHMIGTLHSMPGCKLLELSDALGLSAPTVSVAIKKLEEDGWVERTPDLNDGRAYNIALSDKSFNTFKEILKAQFSGVQRFLTGLNSEEQDMFNDLLEKAISGFELEIKKQKI